MIQNSTKYKNPQRIISGTGNVVFNSDTILLCDTSVGAVELDLLQIPNDQWNTNYKLYVVDYSNNAGTNNITINAPLGFKINNQNFLVISTNGVGAVITISSSTSYLGNLTQNSTGGGGYVTIVNQQNPFALPTTLTTTLDKLVINGFKSTLFGYNNVSLENDFVYLTYAEITFLIGNSTLIPNQNYCITDAYFGNSLYTVEVYLQAITNNTLSFSGIGKLYNADFYGIGDYSGIVGFLGQLGIWQPTLTPIANQVAIWNNYHYLNLTGVNTVLNPELDNVNWQILAYNVTNGYIVASDVVGYNYSLNKILSRQDGLGNYVEFKVDTNTALCSLNRFQWGNNKLNQNKVIGNSMFDNCNTIVSNRMSNNTIINALVYTTDLTNPSYIKLFQNNVFNDQTDEIFVLKILGINPNAVFNNNTFDVSLKTTIILGAGSQFTQNYFRRSEIDFQLSNCYVKGNNFISGTSNIFKTNGNFLFNDINNSIFNINDKTQGSEISNYLLNSKIEVTLNYGLINNNIVKNGSAILCNVNQASGQIINFNLNSLSKIVINNNNYAVLGYGAGEGSGNILNNKSSITIDESDATAKLFGNELSSTQISIEKFNSSTISNNSLKSTAITIANSNAYDLEFLTTKNALLGYVGWDLPRPFGYGQYIEGNGSIVCYLDCSDPVVFDPLTNELFIPIEYQQFCGVFILQNANGITINKIVNLSSKFPSTFYNIGIPSATTFGLVNVAGALANQIITSELALLPSVTINYRLSGQDFIKVQKNGTLNELLQAGIYV